MAAAPQTSPDTHQPPLGLRERKKLRTRTVIRRAAHRLIDEQGYEATTVEQIAAAAEVSPSTVFRYFPTKEDIVLADGAGAVAAVETALRERPAGEPPLEALRSTLTRAVGAALEDAREEVARRALLLVTVPAVRARAAEIATATSRRLSRVLAERSGRAPDDLAVRVVTTAVLGALFEATVHWAEHDRHDDLVVLLEHALDALGSGPAR
ncbi:TetR/AcrR family transcriptional regulator [Streptomyces sp. NPDC059176]|uniref:TetR/AcrR family transcriptional regulator n=1 Tax=unclassified Streptomyces TaxID=2593676 RepID=UPI00367FD112